MVNNDKFILDVLQDTKGMDSLINKVKLESEVQLPKCSCGKTPLRCPQPNNCLMENL